MKRAKLEIGRVRMGVTGAAWPRLRAERIARLAFSHVRELTSREGAGDGRIVGRLTTQPVRVAPGASDEEIARAVGAEVHRSLTRKG